MASAARIKARKFALINLEPDIVIDDVLEVDADCSDFIMRVCQFLRMIKIMSDSLNQRMKHYMRLISRLNDCNLYSMLEQKC
jgi:hypothetical protein